MVTNFGTNAKPLISNQVQFVETRDDLELRTCDATYTYNDRGAQIMAALKHSLDGSRPMADLAGELGISVEKLREALTVLIEDHLLIDAGIIETAQSSGDFFEAYFNFCKFWAKEIFAQPFWQLILLGKANRNLVIGWGIEFYHYTNSANEHMANAVSYCRTDKDVRQWMAQHYIEEHDHAEIFLNGLAACGLDREQVRTAPPLPSTRALINFLNELAIADPLSYLSAFGIMQAPGSGRPVGSYNGFYDLLIKHYEFAAGLIEAYRKHAAIDGDLEHDDMLVKRMIVREQEVSTECRRKMITAARDTLEYFLLYFEGIHDFYSDPDIIIPRRPLDIRMVL